MSPADPRRPDGQELRSEFAAVTVGVDRSGNGVRLSITNLQNGRTIKLDPLELASLTWLAHEHLAPFVDPSRTGWSS